MRIRVSAFVFLIAATALVAGCASTKVLQRQSSAGQALPRPNRVVVYEFAATPDEVEAGSPIAGRYEARESGQTADDIKLGHQLAAQVAAVLTDELASRGIPAVRSASAGALQTNDYLIKGQFISVDQGSRAKRMLIGFGAGASKLESLVQIYRMSDTGPQRVSEAEVTSEGNKMPGMLVPIGAGAAAGQAAKSAVISGGLSTAREIKGAPVDDRAAATGKKIAERIEEAYKKHGWL